MKKKIAGQVLIVVMALSLTGCFVFTIVDKKKGLIAIDATRELFETAMANAGQLCKSEVLSEEECKAISAILPKGQKILLAAKDVWEAMIEADSFDNMAEYNNLINAVVKLIGEIETITRKGG